jgi:hypothetical protein
MKLSWLKGGVNFGYSYSKSNNSLKIQEAFWFADNMPSIYLFLKEADGSIIQDPVYGGNKYDYGQTGRRFGGLTNAMLMLLESRSNRKTQLNMNFLCQIY